ncbi:hypothetical protein TTHERM_00151350 (macronuclear) [Tetrahymena thermophila SB210]|uniref:Uncharacterized protein n=1 Tax=Tetrahymena thermophila (strain SB210) TaxID=312017 RepID=I7M2W4_TETTS|nr:hypothetical protein TTHERM_00151350 [Tetrahymena thermophila SB210]EAS01425.2 hypothetical protein TTHERM_00151350 [Tetrahymena thermophila SB210]|eukprot:XP_001021671.2 hypothetical protein TTHERM_00151350 [Tetrahymena thermophila SB210]
MDNQSQFSNLQKLSESYHSPLRQYNQVDDFSASEMHQEMSQNTNSISPKKLSSLSYPIQTFDTMKRFNTYKAQVEKRKNESLNSSRFQELYEDGQKIQKKREEQIRKKQEEEQNYKDPECTFKPKIKKYNTQSADQDKKTIFDKNQEWKQKVEDKMQTKYENLTDKDLKECTFHPNIDQDWKNKFEEPLSDFNSKGIPQFLKRQVIARKMKEYKDFIMNYPHRKHEMKNNTFTVPNEPVLGICENHIKSLDRPLIPEHLFDSFEQQLHPRQYRSSLSDSKHNKQDQPLNQTYRKMIDNQIQIDPKSNFQDALKQLHEALHNIEI